MMDEFAELREALIRNAGYIPPFEPDQEAFLFFRSAFLNIETIQRESANLLAAYDRMKRERNWLIEKCLEYDGINWFVRDKAGYYTTRDAAIVALLGKMQ